MRFLMDMFHKYDKVGLCGGERVCWHVWDCVCWGVWEHVCWGRGSMCVGGVGTCVLGARGSVSVYMSVLGPCLTAGQRWCSVYRRTGSGCTHTHHTHTHTLSCPSPLPPSTSGYAGSVSGIPLGPPADCPHRRDQQGGQHHRGRLPGLLGVSGRTQRVGEGMTGLGRSLSSYLQWH